MIEAGFFKKAVIVSDVLPYSTLITRDNCLKVKEKVDWYHNCKRLLENPNLSKDLGEALYQSVQKFSLDRVNIQRNKFYQDVCKKYSNKLHVRARGLEVVN
jgi:glycosyltransferase involved in cell wall biosynthesis